MRGNGLVSWSVSGVPPVPKVQSVTNNPINLKIHRTTSNIRSLKVLNKSYLKLGKHARNRKICTRRPASLGSPPPPHTT